MDGAVSADVLAQVSAEYFEEFNRRYGSHVHILDWALHLDEATPHIHERHVFDAIYVFPFPDAPFRMIWWSSDIYRQVENSSICPLSRFRSG